MKYLVTLCLFLFCIKTVSRCLSFRYNLGGNIVGTVFEALERSPIIAATDREGWKTAASSLAEVLFHLDANIMTVSDDIALAKQNGKFVFVHIDLAEGIGKDRAGIAWLKGLGADGIITTRTQLVRAAADCGLLAIQRFFVLDSKGMNSIAENVGKAAPDMIEIMPGVIPKALKLFSGQKIPVIAGGLIETEHEVTVALSAGAFAVSTGKRLLWQEN